MTMKTLFSKKNKKSNGTKKQDNLLILNQTSSFHVQEAYKATRTNTMFSLSGKGCKKIVVTSSLPEEGKSTTCSNLAITFAQTGSRVLIIDADMRRPTIHRKLDILNTNGLSNLLGGFCTLQEAILHTEHDNLDIITSGYLPPNPAELLASEAMNELLMLLELKYDYIIIDTPPVNVVTDATVLSHKVSGMVVVVRQERTHQKDLQEAIGKLEFAQAKILGFILHDVKENKRNYKKYGKDGKYGKYGKYSHYGYKSSTPPQENKVNV